MKNLYYLYSAKFGYIAVTKKYEDAVKKAREHCKQYSTRVTIKQNDKVVEEI